MRRLLAAAIALALVLVLGAVPALGADTFEPVVLIESSDMAVTVTGYEPDGENGPAFDLLLENRTDSDMEFFTEGMAVSGVMSDALWAETVEAGEETTCRLELFTYPERQEELGIRYVRDVQLYLTVLSLSEVDAEYHKVFRGPVSWSVPGTEDLGPASEEPVSDSGFGPIQVMDGDVTAVARDIAYVPGGQLRVTFALHNNTDRAVCGEVSVAALNGAEPYPTWFMLALPGATCVTDCIWTAEELQAAGIEAPDTVDFELLVSDFETFDELADEPFTLDVSGLGAGAD